MNASFTFTGGKELAQQLNALPERVSVSIQRKALRHAAEPIRKEASVLAPVEPGAPDLKDAMTISNLRSGTDDIGADEVAVAVGPARHAFYGFFQEFGTVHHGAQPFLRPAFDQNVRLALRILSTDLWAAIVKRGGGVTGIGTGPGRNL